MKYSNRIRACIAAAAMICATLTASAGNLPHNFVDDDGKVLSITTAYQVEKTTGSVVITERNGSTFLYADASGALHVKLVNYMATTAKTWYRLPGTLIDMNTAEALEIKCYSGTTQTVFSYGNYAKFVADNCAARAAIAAQSN